MLKPNLAKENTKEIPRCTRAHLSVGFFSIVFSHIKNFHTYRVVARHAYQPRIVLAIGPQV